MIQPSLDVIVDRMHWLADYIVSRELSDREKEQASEALHILATQVMAHVPPRYSAPIVPLRKPAFYLVPGGRDGIVS